MLKEKTGGGFVDCWFPQKNQKNLNLKDLMFSCLNLSIGLSEQDIIAENVWSRTQIGLFSIRKT